MSKHEVEEQSNRESVCRNTKRHAVNVVCDRESVQDSFCSEDSIRDNDMLITDLLSSGFAEPASMVLHTTSCLKNSGATPSDKYCRYRLPRSRVAKTSFDALGLELRRTLGHELMNGYNYELMATFKCNHDIQVLLGGVDATERTHYCCKYITKPQKQLDSQVA
ncbi:unnamed protein product [Phytophthora lilii]|uniref:Unnamed protein product n=1 Tax=Phytophthora lilii TaxID=2077276 RepID=A0A9W6TH68_9STRA|nr:unnamed protein product [Phytophthora lilii]